MNLLMYQTETVFEAFVLLSEKINYDFMNKI